MAVVGLPPLSFSILQFTKHMLYILFLCLVQVPLNASFRLPKFDLGGTDKQRIKLDLSGRWRTHLIGSKNAAETTRPLLEVDGLPLSLYVAVDFDLSQRIGPLKWLTTLQWVPRDNPWMSATAERDAKGKMAVQVEAPLGKPFSCRARYADDEPSQVLLKMNHHPRLQTELQLIDTPFFSMASSETATTTNPWIPNVSVSTLGRLNSHWHTCLSNRDNRTVQLRLTVRRRLGWSFLGRSIDDSPETWCSFQVEGSHHPMHMTSATLSGQLENLSSWGLCMRQSVASSSRWPSLLRPNR